MSFAIGIDLGGTKCAVQCFDDEWQMVKERRDPTPTEYGALVALIADQAEWAGTAPLGLSSAGRVHPQTGHMLAANLCANGRPLVADIQAETGRDVTSLNDGQALALSEARFGVGRDARALAAVVLGTGVGGGTVRDGVLCQGPSGLGGEIGHIAAPAGLVRKHALPMIPCDCGRSDCIEQFLSGPGLQRLSQHMTGKTFAESAGAPSEVRAVWLALLAELLYVLTVTIDPDMIVLAGGVASDPHVATEVEAAMFANRIGTFPIPPVRTAQGGDASGARGAAYAAYQSHA